MSAADFARRYGPTALVAGAAKGIGREFVRELLARGLDVVAVDCDVEALEATRASLGAGSRFVPAVCDLAAGDVLAQMRAIVGTREIGLYVHSAASIPFGRFVDDDFAAHARAVAVNCRAPVLLSRLFAAEMAARGRGGIVLLASMAAFQGNGWVATYAGTKAFDLILAESLWWELRGEGVDVLGVAPGATDTEGLWSSGPTIADRSSLARPEDVARESLDALGKAPSLVCGEDNRALRAALDAMERAQAIDLMSSGTKAMCGD